MRIALLILLTATVVAANPAVDRLVFDMPEARVLGILGEPAARSGLVEETAGGLLLKEFSYPTEGLTVTLARAQNGGSLSVYRVEIKEPGLATFGRGGIGATRDQVMEYLRRTYPEARLEADGDGIRATFDEIYVVLFYALDKGHVRRIFLGPGPE